VIRSGFSRVAAATAAEPTGERTMLRRTFIVAGTATLVAGPALAADEPPAGATEVGIEHHAFGPGELHVAVGTPVTWTNHDGAPHTVTADDSSFKSGWLWKNGHFSHTFDKAGSYPYHCSIHKEMHGVVVVA
jgi:plastocyanin